MEQIPRIIVSMTSYPARIKNVPLAIFALLKYQTLKPDEIHLWLAEPEFPNKNADLPKELRIMDAAIANLYIHWLPKNTFAHKKHEYFKIGQPSDCVFLVDDDVFYEPNLIENIMSTHKTYPNAIVAYNLYSQHIYKGIKILYNNPAGPWNRPRFDTRLCTQCMIPFNLYPKDALSAESQSIRDKICPVCDETWLNPFIVRDQIPIYHHNYSWGIDISHDVKHEHGLCVYTHQKESNGNERRDNWLHAVLLHYPDMFKIYQEKFGYGR